ncbi:DUF2218 domain-containing protein [Mesorhizobium sp. WSM3860]|uniref:DUF2218 domain-containing protein n=1 Tax=Mesorhizobium sp. WSM3860 TaxID=2029403 RepID=UPI000BB032C8|nr:DUF2218 domain-containing protein [Mesorhizobium sp. WSM3860]PBC01640.1 hypothetical protein CK220_24975 [Mesorhizobium sp. WSM3860]
MILTGPASYGSQASPDAGRTLELVFLSQDAGSADQLVQRLCVSFVNYATAHSGQRGQIRFPFGWCKVEVHGPTVHITSGAEDMASLKRVEEIVLDRLRRIAHRHRHELNVRY